MNVSTVWNGCNLDVGVGLPGATAAHGHAGTFVFGAITAAFVK